MNLPKNITQIGETDQRCKVYVEDYCVSYIRQMNKQAENRSMAVALYGIQKEEEGVSYIFFYGAGKVQSLQKEVRHLSQAQNQEIEKLRKKYFAQYQFLGYKLLNGEMVEGFHICEQGTCRYIDGYACFYEKNDVMLQYMLDSRKEESMPESVDQEKYDRVKQRQEERRAQYRESISGGGETKSTSEKSIISIAKNIKGKNRPVNKKIRVAVVGVFFVLCALGISSLSNSYNVEDIQAAARKLIAEFSEKKIPDQEEQKETLEQVNTLVAEDKLAEAIKQENEVLQEKTEEHSTEETSASPEDTEQTIAEEPSSEIQKEEIPPTKEPESVQPSEPVVSTQQTIAPEPYIIKKGDTLTSISIRIYGTDAKVKEICTLNNIKNPDDIQSGQKILLP